MIELVIPTLWKSPKLHKMLPKYVENPYVSAIHIYDNGQEFDKHYGKQFSPKIRVYTPHKYNEWYINPAWNMGVSAASQNSIVGLLNDDIEFDLDIFDFILWNSEDIGILGMHSENYKNVANKNYEIVDIPQHMMGWGCAIFFDKRNWSIIPPQLKLYFGDSYQFHVNEIPCKALKGVPMADSNISETTARGEFFKEFDEMYRNERDWFFENIQQSNLNLGK